MERQLVNALNELYKIHSFLNGPLFNQSLIFFERFENNETFSEYDLLMIEWMVETGMKIMPHTEQKTPIITKDLLEKWVACKDGYDRFNELFPEGADLETAIDGLIEDGHDDWGLWIFNHCHIDGFYPDIISKGYRNAGSRNAGSRNAGDSNAGSRNAGDSNAGNSNAGDSNAGSRNAGDSNAGDSNAGDSNAGNSNAGDSNAGDSNAGSRNAGSRNAGSWNAGSWNAGDSNAGSWNAGNSNAGNFNSESDDEIHVFNKPCERQKWIDAYKPNFIFFDITFWVDESEMTEADKVADSQFYVIGGQLRTKDYKEAFQESWGNSDPIDREKIRDLPNFDADVFYEISGIDLRDKGEIK